MTTVLPAPAVPDRQPGNTLVLAPAGLTTGLLQAQITGFFPGYSEQDLTRVFPWVFLSDGDELVQGDRHIIVMDSPTAWMTSLTGSWALRGLLVDRLLKGGHLLVVETPNAVRHLPAARRCPNPRYAGDVLRRTIRLVPGIIRTAAPRDFSGLPKVAGQATLVTA